MGKDTRFCCGGRERWDRSRIAPTSGDEKPEDDSVTSVTKKRKGENTDIRLKRGGVSTPLDRR